MSDSDKDRLLDEWERLKVEVKVREKRLDELKLIAAKLMEEKRCDSLVGSNGRELVRNRQSYLSLTKDCVPSEIFKQYAKKTDRVVFTMRKAK